MISLKPAILFFFMLVSFTLSAQSDLLKGKLLDAGTKEPIAFATVRVKGKAVGVISNFDGSFSIPEKFKIYGDTLQISSMGYKNRQILISTLSTEIVREILIQPGLFELEEAVVMAKRKRGLSARQIVRRAIKNIPKNYPSHSFSTVGYYRDYQLREGVYLNLNEAILEVFDKGFNLSDYETSKVQIYDYNVNNEFAREPMALQPYDYKKNQKTIDHAFLNNYGGNEFTILRVHDAIRNYNINSYSFVNRFDLNLIGNHNFSKDENTYLNDVILYTIKFKKRYSDFSANGTLYISSRDFSIYKMEYALYDNRKRTTEQILNKKYTRNQLIFEVLSEYQKRDGKMYLNYISFQNNFQLFELPEFIVDEIIIDRPRKCFEVRFNKEIDPVYAAQMKNYRFKFRGKKLAFRKIVVLKKSVRLFPEMGINELNEMIVQLKEASTNTHELKDLLDTQIKDLRSLDPRGAIYSSLLNERKPKKYRQFREFFVQQVKSNALPSLNNALFMNKSAPIFAKDQPIVRPDNFDDYWMNTPLQKVE